jgi:hypothetical protein
MRRSATILALRMGDNGAIDAPTCCLPSLLRIGAAKAVDAQRFSAVEDRESRKFLFRVVKALVVDVVFQVRPDDIRLIVE